MTTSDLKKLFIHSSLISVILALPWIRTLIGLRNRKFEILSFSGDMEFYVSRCRAFWEGLTPGNFYTSEKLTIPDAIHGGVERPIFAIAGRILSPVMSFELFLPLLIITSTVFAVLGILYFSIKLFKEIHRSILIIYVLIFFTDRDFSNIFSASPLIINRWPLPLFHFLILISAGYILTRTNGSKRIILTVTLFLASYFVYPYTWALLLLLVIFTSIAEVLHSRKFLMANLLNPLATLSALASLLTLTGAGSDLFSRGKEGSLKDYMYEKIYTNSPDINKSIILSILLTIFIIKFLDLDYRLKIFIIASTLAAVVSENAQMVVGFEIQPAHFHRYWTFPLILIFLTLIVASFKKEYWLRIWILTVSVILAINLFTQILVTKNSENYSVYDIENKSNNHLKGKVFSTEYEILNQNIISSHSGVTWHAFALFQDIDRELAERSVLAAAIWEASGVNQKDPFQYLNDCDSYKEPCTTLQNLAGENTKYDLREFNSSELSTQLVAREAYLKTVKEKYGYLAENPRNFMLQHLKESGVVRIEMKKPPTSFQVRIVSPNCKISPNKRITFNCTW